MSGDDIQQSDFIVPGRSNRQLRQIAAAMRLANGLVGRVIDIVGCLASGWLVTTDSKYPRKRLVVEVLPDADMGRNDGLTLIDKDRILMRFKESVWIAAKRGNGRARFTLCHEYAHAILNHKKAAMARATEVNKTALRPTFINKYESAEHKADYAAAETLVDFELVSEAASADTVAFEFQVSIKCAENILQSRQSLVKSVVVREGLKKLRDTLSGNIQIDIVAAKIPRGLASVGDGSAVQSCRSESVISDLCPECGQDHVLDSIGGNKYTCSKSGRAGIFHPDGDDPWEMEN